MSSLLFALFLAAPAFAVDQDGLAIDTRAVRLKDPAGYAADLTGGKPSERQFAARELRRLARMYARKATGDGDPALEARASLQDLRRDALASAEIAVVDARDIRASCADLLAIIGQRTSVTALEKALEAEDRPRVDKRIEAAILALR